MRVVINDVVYVPAAPTCTDKSPLETRMFVADLDREVSLREYMHALLATLWRENEGFSGKRPFGNSGWDHDVYKFLVKAGAVTGVIDEDGYLEDFDQKAADKLVPGLLAAAFNLERNAS